MVIRMRIGLLLALMWVSMGAGSVTVTQQAAGNQALSVNVWDTELALADGL